MKKKILLTFVGTLIFFTIVSIKVLAIDFILIEEDSLKVEDQISQIPVVVNYYDPKATELSLAEIKNKINECEQNKILASQIINYAKNSNWPDNCFTIENANIKYCNASIIQKFYKEIYQSKIKERENQVWNQKKSTYPEASYIWKYLKEIGWNDYVCAGIIGNIMTEVGGNTLNLNPSAGTNYYGICQWNKNHKKVQKASLKDQCNYLRDTIEYEINTYGFIFKKNFNFNSFLKLNSYEEAALAFAKVYERCDSSTYSLRQKNAKIAYNYFTN